MKKVLLSIVLVLSSTIVSAQEKGLDQQIDEAFAPISDFVSNVVFFKVAGYPFVILLLVGSAMFLHYILDFQILNILRQQLM